MRDPFAVAAGAKIGAESIFFFYDCQYFFGSFVMPQLRAEG
jgi:hypothetical protein